MLLWLMWNVHIGQVLISLVLHRSFYAAHFLLCWEALTVKEWSRLHIELVFAATIVAAPVKSQHFYITEYLVCDE